MAACHSPQLSFPPLPGCTWHQLLVMAEMCYLGSSGKGEKSIEVNPTETILEIHGFIVVITVLIDDKYHGVLIAGINHHTKVLIQIYE